MVSDHSQITDLFEHICSQRDVNVARKVSFFLNVTYGNEVKKATVLDLCLGMLLCLGLVL